MKLTSYRYFLKIIIMIMILSFTILSYGDVIYLKNGRKVSGEIISETETLVSIKTVLGRMVVKQKDIVRIQREEDEINYIRNGDYLMTRGEYNAAVTEFESALRLDPANPDIAAKLSEAKRKAAEALSSSMAPDFVKGDEFLTKGYYESAVREYKNVVREHNDNQAYVLEADIKMQNLFNIMMTKAKDLASQQDYNKSFEIFQLATSILPAELSQEASKTYENVLKEVFAEEDLAYQSGQFSKAIQGYNKLVLSYPGDPVREAVKSRLERIAVDLTYQVQPEEEWSYMTRAQFSVDPAMIAIIGSGPGVFQQMDFNIDMSYKMLEIVDNGNANVELMINKASITTTLIATGKKQSFVLDALTNKKVSGQFSPRGDSPKLLDLSKIVYSKGITGERLDQNAFTSIIGVVSRLPVIQPGKLKIGDTWSELVNEHRNVGPLDLNTNGQINYALASFETLSGHDCAKISMDAKLTSTLKGTVGGQEGQQQNVDVTYETPLTGSVYMDHNQRIPVRYSMNGDIKIKGELLGIRTIQQNRFPQGLTGPGEFFDAEGRGGRPGPGGPLGPEGAPPEFYQLQTQTQQQTIPEITVRLALDRSLTNFKEGVAATPVITPESQPSQPVLSTDTVGGNNQ